MAKAPAYESQNPYPTNTSASTSASSNDTELLAIMMTNLNNAEAVWGKDSERYRVMEGIATSLATQKQRQEDSDSVLNGVSVTRPGGESQGVAFGELVLRPKST